MLLLSLDIKKAFDTTWRYRVPKKLQKWGLTGHIIYLMKNFLNNRSFKVALNGNYSSQYALENGIPQGSPINTTLFLVTINNIVKQIPKLSKMSLYADDSYVWIRHKNLKYIDNIIEQGTNNLNKREKNQVSPFHQKNQNT